MKVFVSYKHNQGKWVWERLVPSLRAGGPEVLIDRERFKAGSSIAGQMDDVQDRADRHLLVLSDGYESSKYCKHEMNRAIDLDPDFTRGIVIPVLREHVRLPDRISRADPLCVDLIDDAVADAWEKLFAACGANLRTAAPIWLRARDKVIRYLSRDQSVNLVIKGDTDYRLLLQHLKTDYFPDIGIVDLYDPVTVSRRGLLMEILKALGLRSLLPPPPEDLVEYGFNVSAAQGVSRIALMHFDLAAHRTDYGIDLFSTLRYQLMDSRRLVLLAQSRNPFGKLLPHGHPLSEIDIKTVELG